jgi:hypothetical protein
MEELDVAAPGAGAGRTRVGVDPADRGLAGFRHRTPPWVVRTTEVSADWGSAFLGRKTNLPWSFVARPDATLEEPSGVIARSRDSR